MNENFLTAVEEWIHSQPDSVALSVKANATEKKSLCALLQASPEFEGTLTEAVLWLRIAAIDRAHEIVQNGATALDRYLHGVVHRIEGDFWNSKYWFRQVNDDALLAQIGLELLDRITADGTILKIEQLQLFDSHSRFIAANFVDAQAALKSNASSSNYGLVQRIAQAEWEAIWKICRGALSGLAIIPACKDTVDNPS